MDVAEAIDRRRSIRCFRSDPVPQDVLRGIVQTALRSPSASNSQPWELAVVSGGRLDKIKQAFLDNASRPPSPDIPLSARYPDPWASRRAAVMTGILEKLGVAPDDRQARAEWGLSVCRLWGAPSCVYLMMDRAFYHAAATPNVWNLFDCGLIAQDLLLLATEQGLGTVPAVQPVVYPDILRKILGISDSKLIVLAIAIGYPNNGNPINDLRADREPLDLMARFYT
jgi:nitroreductase